MSPTEGDNLKRIWGQEFRIVPEGLDESDVKRFVDELIRRYESSVEKASHIEELHALATKTVEEAERMAGAIKKRAEEEGERLAGQIKSDAGCSAAEVVHRAVAAGNAIEAEAYLQAREKVDELQTTLSTMERLASEEFNALKQAEERLGVFLSAFESFLLMLQKSVGRSHDKAALTDLNGAAAAAPVVPGTAWNGSSEGASVPSPSH